MKERILQLLDLEHLTPSKFADLIGVQRSSVSHILSDRNKPSFDFLQKTLKTFPGLKAEWLMLGDGPMYDQMGRESADLFSQEVPEASEHDSHEAPDIQQQVSLPLEHAPAEAQDFQDIEEDSSSKSRKVVQVMLFYDDDTFVSYKPSE